MEGLVVGFSVRMREGVLVGKEVGLTVGYVVGTVDGICFIRFWIGY